jgi:hypothetical protein
MKGSKKLILAGFTVGNVGQLSIMESAAKSRGLRLQALNVGRPDHFGTVFAAAQKNHAEALIKTAKALGVRMPESLLVRADQVIR